MWEANLTHLLDAGSLTHVVDDTVASPFGDKLVRSVAYTPNQRRAAWANETWCFRTAFLGNAHTHGAELVFHARSATRAKRAMWRDYRDLLVRKFCPACAAELAAAAAARRPLAGSCASRRGAYRILVAVRTHDPGSSSFLFANGRGRRVVNVGALVAALAPLGDVEAFDPGLLPLGDQIRKAASADVLVSRMSSQVVLAMFVPPGGLAPRGFQIFNQTSMCA